MDEGQHVIGRANKIDYDYNQTTQKLRLTRREVVRPHRFTKPGYVEYFTNDSSNCAKSVRFHLEYAHADDIGHSGKIQCSDTASQTDYVT